MGEVAYLPVFAGTESYKVSGGSGSINTVWYGVAKDQVLLPGTVISMLYGIAPPVPLTCTVGTINDTRGSARPVSLCPIP